MFQFTASSGNSDLMLVIQFMLVKPKVRVRRTEFRSFDRLVLLF